MCGIVACLLGDDEDHCVTSLIDALTMLQHRGQDAAGVATRRPDGCLSLHKDNGLVSEVFNEKRVLQLVGNVGIGHTRYPTAGSSNSSEAQPFYTNTPCGLCLAHNGSLTNTTDLRRHLLQRGPPLPHAQEARMTVVTQTPSNEFHDNMTFMFF